MGKELTGRGVLFWLVGSFAVVLTVNVLFIVVSVKTFRGEDEQRPYLQGVEFNQTLARRSEQEKLGWTAQIGANRLPTGKVRIAVLLEQSNGIPQTHAALIGELRHPSDENQDHPLRLREMRAGEYVGDIADVSPGAWDVIVTSSKPRETPFEASRRLWVP